MNIEIKGGAESVVDGCITKALEAVRGGLDELMKDPAVEAWAKTPIADGDPSARSAQIAQQPHNVQLYERLNRSRFILSGAYPIERVAITN